MKNMIKKNNLLPSITIRICISCLLLCGCGGSGSSSSREPQEPSSTQPPSFYWETSSPEEQGMDPNKVQEIVEYVLDDDFNTQGLIVVRGNKIVVEEYRGISESTLSGLQSVFSNNDWDFDIDEWRNTWGTRDQYSLVTSWSTAKSFASSLIGIAIEEGFIDSVDQYASTYLPNWTGTDKENSVTIKDILEMRSRLQCPLGGNGGSSIYYQEDQLTPSIERDFNQDPPDNGWVYCNADTMLLGEILLNATGFDAMEFGERYLFSKIGMTVDWWRDGENKYLTYCCLDTTTRDFARFGLLWLNQGVWQGEQIISSTWIEESLKPAAKVNWSETIEYGYQWYMHEGLNDGEDFLDVFAFGAKGYSTNHITIVPSYDLVIVRNSLYSRNINVGSESVRTGDLDDLDNANYHLTLYPGNLFLRDGQVYLMDSSNIKQFNSEAMVKGFIESLIE
tara:strand:+ start:2003 stop:3349 length:1347 start_codon:yes stop_codon:yes gene_type:complete